MNVPEKNIESKFKKMKDAVVSDIKGHLQFYSVVAAAVPVIIAATYLIVTDFKNDMAYVADNTFTDTVTVANTAATEQSMSVLDTEDRVISYSVNALETNKITSLDLRILVGGQVEFTGYVEQGDTTGTKIIATDLRPLKPVEPVDYASK